VKSISCVCALLLLFASPALGGDDAGGPETERVGPSAADPRHRPAGCDTCAVDNPANSKAQPFPAASFSWPKGVRGALSISFDDARESQVDHRSAALFKQHGIRATYFVSLTNVKKKQDLWRAVAADGHEIGNHSVHHPCSGNFPWIGPGERALENYTLEKIEAELLEANRSLRQMLGVTPVSYAYPCGLDFVGRGENRASYVPVVARHFLVGRGYRGEYLNNPAFCDLAMVQALGVDRDGLAQLATSPPCVSTCRPSRSCGSTPSARSEPMSEATGTSTGKTRRSDSSDEDGVDVISISMSDSRRKEPW